MLWPRAGAQRGFSFPCHSPGPQQKKQITMGGVLFFALAPCRRPTGLLLPLPFPVAGAKKKQHPGWCFFFGSGPVPAPNGASPSLAFGRSKKKHTPWVVFIFLLWPRAGAQRRFSFPCLSPGPEQKKNTLGFCSGPVPAPNGASPSPALPRGRSKKNTLAGCFFLILLWPRAGAQGRIKKKNTLGGVFFFCSGPVPAPNEASPSPAFPRGRSKKKKHPGWCFFFLLWPRAGAQGRSKKKKKTPWVVFIFCSGPVPAPNEASPSPAFPRDRSKKKTPWVVFFFLLWPRAGAQGRSKKKHPVFFFALAPCRRPTGLLLPLPFPGAGAKKKNTLGGVFFFALAPCRRPTELLLPLPSAAVKKNTHPGWCLFFCSGPVPAPNGASPSPAFLRGRSKKKTPWVFALAPCRRPTGLLLPLPFPGAGAKKNTLGGVFFFLLWPRAGAQGRIKKKTPWVVFFFCSGPVPAPNEASPSPAFPRGRSKKKKNTLGGVFFLLWPRAGAQGRSKKNHPGWCLFFALAPCRRPTKLLLPLPFPGAGAKKKKKHTLGGVFFFCSGPVPAPNEASPSPAFPRGQSKKKSPWVVFVFLLWPRAGAQGRSKKQHPGWCFFFALAPCRRPTKLLLPLPLAPGPEQKKKHPGWCFFFLLWPRAGAQGRSKKNHPGWCFFFCSGPVPAPNGASPSPAFPRGRSKKKKNNTLGGVFFLLWPRRGAQRTSPSPAFPRGRRKKTTPWVVVFFLLWPRAGAQGRSKKKNTLGGVFFFALAPCRRPTGLLLPLPFPGAGAKKKKQHPGWCFFFALAPPRRPTECNKKKTLCTPGPTAKNFLETHDAGHEQKGATTKKKTP